MKCEKCLLKNIRLITDKSIPSTHQQMDNGGFVFAYPLIPAPDGLCYDCERMEFRKRGLTKGGREATDDGKVVHDCLVSMLGKGRYDMIKSL